MTRLATQAAPPTDGFHGMSPLRVLDTRLGPSMGGPAFGAGDTRALALVPTAVPAQAVAVALNVTVTEPTAASYVTVWPHGVAPPATSNLNVVARQTVANLVIVKLGAGQVALRNAFGSAHVVVDVMGWFASGFEGVAPARLMDTRPGRSVALRWGQARRAT